MLQKMTLVLFVLLTGIYYYFTFGTIATNELVLTISSFLFAIFTGFFMARQGSRYSEIRNQIAEFDGLMNALYRQFGHIGAKQQASLKKIITAHYQKILKSGAWDYQFLHKSSTITDIHALVENEKKTLRFNAVKHLALQNSMSHLDTLQVIRKRMINLHLERIPASQWALILMLAVILLLSVSAIPSPQNLISSSLKGAFGTSVVIVLVLLYEFDTLKFFEGTIGEKSAKDVLDILAGKK